MLTEVGAALIEAIAMVRLIRYLKKIEQMEDDRWPKVVFNDILCKRKKTWMRQNNKWLSKWDIYLNMCPTNSNEIKVFVIDKFHKQIWGKGMLEKTGCWKRPKEAWEERVCTFCTFGKVET